MNLCPYEEISYKYMEFLRNNEIIEREITVVGRDYFLDRESTSDIILSYLALKSSMYFFASGSDAGEFRVSGFRGLPFCQMRKSRCGPVAVPVAPT